MATNSTTNNPFNPPVAIEPALDPDNGTHSFPWYQWFSTKVAKGLNAPVNANVPPTAASNGTVGQIAQDGDYVYVCTGTNQWKRAALTAF
jgi:hypothetical protein